MYLHCRSCGWNDYYYKYQSATPSMYPNIPCPACSTTGQVVDKEGHAKFLKGAGTQKVKGIANLHGLTETNGLTILSIVALFRSIEDVEKWTYPLAGSVSKNGLFARPCPVVPRHGFVDSRVIKSKDELLQVMKETKAAEPEGEVMLMNFIDSKYNIVWTPSLLTIGLGNDGATAGKDTLNIPLSGKNPFHLATLVKSGIDPATQDPYIEGVYDKMYGAAHLTQLRAGVKGDGRVDFIPFKVKVEEVLSPNGMDLLKWEELIISCKDKKGIVVGHKGGSPTDHYGVHARTYSIPVITSREVAVGETLEPIPYTPPSPSSVLEGVYAASSIKLESEQYQSAIIALLMGLHNSSKLEGEDGFWIGVSAGFMLRFGAMALRGEARHINGGAAKESRRASYNKSIKMNLYRHRVTSPKMINILRYGNFGGGGVGGRKWAECGGALADLFDTVYNLAKTNLPEDVNVLLRKLNTAINQAHNGGWWMNKFSSMDTFNDVQKGFLRYPLQTVPLLWKLDEERKGVSADEMEKFRLKTAQWGPMILKHSPIMSVQLNYLPGGEALRLTVKDALLKESHREIVVPATVLTKAFEKIKKGDLFLSITTDGIQIEVRAPKQQPIVVWKEKEVKSYDAA